MPVALRYGSTGGHTFPHVVGAPFSLFSLYNLSALKATRPTADQNLIACAGPVWQRGRTSPFGEARAGRKTLSTCMPLAADSAALERVSMDAATAIPASAEIEPTPDRARSPAHVAPAKPRETSVTPPAGTPSAEALPRPADDKKKAHLGRGDLLLYLLLTMLVAAAWQISEMKLFKANDDLNYWIGVTGGSMMLVLFTYPLRKYVRFMQGLGNVKWWFWFHLFLGIAGPWLILVHSTFHLASLNASVALYSMCIVVVSGVIGRFIYVRIHRGLDGQRMSLQELRVRAGLVESNARSRLHFSPAVEAWLLAFEQHELRAQPGWLTHLRQVTLLPLQQQIAYLRCVIQLHFRLRDLAAKKHWSPADLRRRERSARRLVGQYLDAVVRVAQYSAYERVFALWHLAHLPFVYLLVISAVVHVVAVHAY
jgi:hypothetical protein